MLKLINNFQLDKNNVFVKTFCAAMDDDFNTPEALAVLFDLAKQVNLAKQAENNELVMELASTLKALGALLGLLQLSPESFLQGDSCKDEVTEIERLIKQRNDARANKDWACADDARDKLKALNVILEDSSGKTTWRKA